MIRPPTTIDGNKHRGPPRWWAVPMCLLAALLLAADSAKEKTPGRGSTPSGEAEVSKTGRGHLVRVPLPIKGSVDDQVKETVKRLLDDLSSQGPRPIFIFEFYPKSNTQGEGSEFERSLSLARFLASDRLGGVRTVAYVPHTIKGHAILPAMACEQIIMHPDAEIREAGHGESSIDATVRRGYVEVANRRRTIPEAVALGLLDPRVAVFKVNGNKYVLADELEELKRNGEVTTIETIVPTGEMGRFTGRSLRLEHGFVSHLVGDRNELAQVLKLPASAIELDPSHGKQWRPIRVDLKGPIKTRLTNQVQNAIAEQMRIGTVNFVLLYLDSPGGSPEDTVSLVSYLTSLDESKVRTVAYIPVQARGDAALVAMACHHVVMGRSAELGGPGTYQMSEQEVEDLTETIRRSIARQKPHNWSLWAAMIDPNLEVFLYKQRGTAQTKYFSAEELAEQVDPTSWIKVERETAPNEQYKVDAVRAKQVGIARDVVDDFEGLKGLYHLEGRLDPIKPNWAYELINALAAQELAWALLFIGGFALMSELMSPGVGIPGFVAGICFLLFFWSQFLHGTAGWLEIVLFVGGITFLALEIFVIPGFGIFGLGGGAMMIVSLVLATQTFVWPRNDYQFGQVPFSIFPVVAMGAGVVAALVLMRHFLPKAPVVSQVVLSPPEGEDLEELSRRESLVDLAHLVGKRGRATTQLTPSGKARFGDELIDVISDGDVIRRGMDVYVVEVQGNRVIVQAIDSS